MKRKAMISTVCVLLTVALSLTLIRFEIFSKVSALEEYERQVLKQYGDGKEIPAEYLNEAVNDIERYIKENRRQLWITSYEVTGYQVTVSIAGIFKHAFLPNVADKDLAVRN